MSADCLRRLLILCLLSKSLTFAQQTSFLFDNLRSFQEAHSVGDPSVTTSRREDGPKGFASGDLDGDGFADLVAGDNDGSLTVLFGKGDRTFHPPQFLDTGDRRGVRDVIVANLFGDARPEIAAAHPFTGQLVVFNITGTGRTFSPPRMVPSWTGARSLAAGDFNGDGKMDLAVAGSGDGFREFRGDGLGGFAALPIPNGISAPPARIGPLFPLPSASPVFSLHVWRKGGESRDRVAMTYAGAEQIFFLHSPQSDQALQLSAFVPTSTWGIYDLALAFMSPESRISGEPDLVTTSQDSGEIQIRKFELAGNFYSPAPTRRLAVPGGPRAITVRDLDNDSWPDIVAAGRYNDTVSLFRNVAGQFTLTSRTPSGGSPRDVLAVDLDNNGVPEVPTINRYSQDITVHRIDPTTHAFFQSPWALEVRGYVQSAVAKDLDSDGKDEILVTSWRSDATSIYKINSAGGFVLAGRYGLLASQSTQPDAADLDGDGKLDLVNTLGQSHPSARITYRRQLSDGTFGPLADLPLPPNLYGQVHVSLRDLNGDGRADYLITHHTNLFYYESSPDGSWIQQRADVLPYSIERPIQFSDLDKDGDLDFVASTFGGLGTIQNSPSWRDGTLPTTLRTTTGGAGNFYPLQLLPLGDIDGNTFQDFAILTWDGIATFKGMPNLEFQSSWLPNQESYCGTAADFNSDGHIDAFTAGGDGRTAYLAGANDSAGPFARPPASTFSTPGDWVLFSGDFDGDGKPDLGGGGQFLWVALSGVAPKSHTALPFSGYPVDVPAVVINEVLANTATYIAPGTTRTQDCVELFNGTDTALNLAGWRLRLVAPAGATQAADSVFPDVTLPARQHFTIYCTGTASNTSAPFKLPASGGVLHLLKTDGATSDLVTYPSLDEDVSFARVADGARGFYLNPLPGIGVNNYDNGNPAARLEFRGVDLAQLKLGKIRLRALGSSTAGLINVGAAWRAKLPDGTYQSGYSQMHDSGAQGDAAPFDSVYTGDLPALPPTTEVEFYVHATDTFGWKSLFDRVGGFSTPGETVQNYTLSIPAARSGWEIAEVLAANRTGLRDSFGQLSDWAEIRYTGTGQGSTAGLYLADSLFGDNEANLYPLAQAGASLPQGGSFIVFLNGSLLSATTPMHAPFKADNEGDTIYLFRKLPSGVREIVDWVVVPRIDPDQSYARVGAAGDFVITAPTPGTPTGGPGGIVHLVPAVGGSVDAIFVFAGPGRVEVSEDLINWQAITAPFVEDGVEHVFREPANRARRFFRVR
jgi:hypothetical protein